MDLRLQFISEYLAGWFSMTELVTQYGISRKTGYKWVGRYEWGGPAALVDQSRRPHQHPATTDAAVVQALLAARQRHPRWGAKKLLALVKRHGPTMTVPSRSTVCHLLRRHGLSVPRQRRRRVPHGGHGLAPVTGPNATWTTDFKGEFRTRDSIYCYPLTVRDGFSRYVLCCEALLTRGARDTRRCFEHAFGDYGLPERIRSDNGTPFAGPGLGRLSQLNVWWMRLGIIPERIAVGHPEQNGAHEQFHAVLKAETARPPAANRRAQQHRFDAFCREYNTERPHESLHDCPPATRYRPSRRALPPRVPPLEYAGHMEVRRVSCVGSISWRGVPVFLTEVLRGEDVAFEEVDDGIWTLYFGSVRLGRFDERTRAITALPTIPQATSAPTCNGWGKRTERVFPSHHRSQ
jgi:transposase InsO family protein